MGQFGLDLGLTFTLRACPPTHLQAAQFLRSAAFSQRNFLAAQFLLFLANRGGPRGGTQGLGPQRRVPQAPQGWPKGQGAQGALRAPWGGKGAFGALGAHWGHWDNSEAIPNGIVLRFHLAGWRQARMDGLVPIFLAMDQAAQSIKSQ